DYSATVMAQSLGVAPKDARLFMVHDGRWKLMQAEGGFRPMLFDTLTDPTETIDLGADPAHEETRARLLERLNLWARRPSQRTTVSDAQILARRGKSRGKGIYLGVWDEEDLSPDQLATIQGPAGGDYRD
ncbi:MAG: phosphonate monoester hydrolase, partial [Rhodobacterales bacterium]|nr:phosphonate monoester hydrolase [Rhodobacterales bacterium]MDX5412620.1 phosphonate monoester hydrolase [Rhodobacterales bacterium]